MRVKIQRTPKIKLCRGALGSAILAVALLAACGNNTVQRAPASTSGTGRITTDTRVSVQSTTPPTTVGANAPTTPASPTAGLQESPTSKPTGSSARGRAVAVARRKIARHTGISAASLKLVSVRPKTWPDSSLGCPRPGTMYSQIVTPGYIVVLKSKGTRYEVHTGRGTQATICTPKYLNK